jgi:hypothetical protein
MFSLFKKAPKRPDALLAAQRSLILTSTFLKALVTPPRAQLEVMMSAWSEQDRAQFPIDFNKHFDRAEEELRKLELWGEMTDSEKDFIRVGVLETTERQQVDASWLAESITCLLWALGRLTTLPRYDEESGHEPIKLARAESRALLSTASLRPKVEIDRQRDWAEVWHWRCRTRQLSESGRLPKTAGNGMTMDEIIRLTSEKAATDGVFEAPIGDDFPAFGKAFSALSGEEFIRVTSISMERHKALNWLCGYAPGNRWDETPTGT